MRSTDLLIVDTKHDLNVYFSTEESDLACCGETPAAKAAPSCFSTRQTGESCKTIEARPGSGSSTYSSHQQNGSMPNKARQLAAGLGITDLNEWAGKQATEGKRDSWVYSFRSWDCPASTETS